MSLNQRLNKTGTIRRMSGRSDDGYGGITQTEAEIDTGLKFRLFSITPWDRQAFASEYGFEKDAVIKKGTCILNDNLQNGDIIEVSKTERYRVLSVEPMDGIRSETHHLAIIVCNHGNRS